MPAITAQPSPRVLASRRNGALGGLARAKKYSKKQIREWSAKGGETTAELYGPELKQYGNRLRKTHGRYRKPADQCNVKGGRLKKKG